jgi:hypothetical protein
VENRVDFLDVEEAQAGPVDAQRLAVAGRGRFGEGDHVVHDRLDVVDDRNSRPAWSTTSKGFDGFQRSHART